MIDVVDQEIEIEKEGFQEIKIVIEGMEVEVEVGKTLQFLRFPRR